MPTTDELRRIGIVPWPDISREFREADLLLGNGFSLMLNELFRYDSLFERFLSNCSQPEADAFRRFGSANFEYILESLQTALRVDEIFGINNQPISDAANRLKEGLIATVSQNHPRSSDLNRAHLTTVSELFDHFMDIYTLSYDALLYHIIMITLDRHRFNNAVRPYSDYFWEPFNEEFLQFMTSQNIAKYKRVYYLHGALFIFRLAATTFKIRRTDHTELLELIENQIQVGNIPLFVSEGTSEEKLFAISRSEYLHFAHEYLKRCSNRLVVFGASLSRPDNHIVQAIRKPERRIAISIRVGEQSLDDLRREMTEHTRKFPNQGLYFFNSSTFLALA